MYGLLKSNADCLYFHELAGMYQLPMAMKRSDSIRTNRTIETSQMHIDSRRVQQECRMAFREYECGYYFFFECPL